MGYNACDLLDDLYDVWESLYINSNRFDYSQIDKNVYKKKIDINKFPKVRGNLKHQKGSKKYKR